MATLIERRYADLHPKCADLAATATELFPNSVTHDARNLKPFPYYITHGLGSHKWDVDGQDIIDYRTGHGSLILGHSHPEVVAAVNEQMAKGTHYAASTTLEIQWAELIRDLIPSSEKVRFHSSGTEATMMAFKMARAYTGKTRIIKFEDHFHGWHDYARADEDGSGGIPDETASTMISLHQNDIGLVEQTIQEDGNVAAIILEPTGSHMGTHALPPVFLEQLREVATRHGVVLIFDEVVTGFRISKGGAQAKYGVMPDLTTMAKIVAGGLPGGAITGRADLIDMIQLTDDPEFNRTGRVGHNGTFNANPLSAAAGTTALNLVKTTDVNARADAMAARLKEGLNDILIKQEVPGCASGVASIVFLRIGADHECDKEICLLTDEQQRATENGARNHQLGLSLYSRGVDVSSGRFILSATHTDEDVDATVDEVEQALVEVRAEGLL